MRELGETVGKGTLVDDRVPSLAVGEEGFA
jgi:hypothetical protein